MQTEKTDPAVLSFSLSPQQEHLWLLGAGEPGYRVQCSLLIEGELDSEQLRSALGEVVARHEILRTTFVRRAGVKFPSQVVHDGLDPAWEQTAAEGADVRELLAREASRPVDFESGPLVRALLAELDKSQHLFVLTVPSLCADLTSIRLAATEILASYGGSGTSGEPLQYADFAAWRHEIQTEDDEEAAAGRAYWEGLELDESTPQLLFSSPASQGTLFNPESVVLEIDDRVRGQIEDSGIAPELFVEACWHALVARLSGQKDVLVASIVDGRSHEELEGAVGSFAQALPIRSRLEEDTSLSEIVDQVRRGRAEADRYQDYQSLQGLTAVAENVGLGFAWVDTTSGVGPAATTLAIRGSVSRFALQLAVEADDRWRGRLDFDPAVFTVEDVEQIAASFTTLLTSAASDPSAPVIRLEILPTEERERLVTAFNGTRAEFPQVCFHHLIEDQARRVPEATAVASTDQNVTYAELNETANRLAHRLRELGVGRNVVVGLCMDRSPEMVSALLGILKAGGAYLPLNFEHPAARIAHQLGETNAPVLVTQQALLDSLPEFAGEVICVDRDGAVLGAQSTDDPDRINEPDDLAYVMYTSGSTGLPKGVAVTHRNVVNYTIYMAERIGADREQLDFGVVSAISTDLGNTSVFTALASGGCLRLINPEASMDGDLLAADVEDRPLDVLKITPSHLSALLAATDATRILPRRWLITGGEACTWDLIERVTTAGRCRMINHYGPTETTIGSCTFDVGTDVSAWRPSTVPVGKPIANTQVYIVDPTLSPVPVGVAGELCIGGLGVSRGYIGQPEQTAELFVDDPFSENVDARLYRTGDRARYLPDGNIEFLGRKDAQVKIRGFRVEPAEVEAALLRHPAVRQAAVLAREDGHGDPRLVGYVVASPEPKSEELHAFLQDVLPDFMIPATFATLEALPFTPSGKIDRLALPDPATLNGGSEKEYVAPRTPLEEALAEIWAEILGLERVGVEDDFFALGGHSLLATQVIARVRGTYADIPLHSIFSAPTVAGLAEVILQAQLAEISDEEAEALLALDGQQGDGEA